MFLLDDITGLAPEERSQEKPYYETDLYMLEEMAYATVAKKYYAEKKERTAYGLTRIEDPAGSGNSLILLRMTGTLCAPYDRHDLEAPRQGMVALTEGEYLFLLTQLLLFGSSFKFAHLMERRPDLGRKIIEQLYGTFEDEQISGFLYYVTFDEVFENAKEVYQLKDWYFPQDVRAGMFF